MLITHFESDGVSISYDPELKLGIATWNGFLSSERFREAVGVCIDLIDEHKLLRWLGDNRKLRVIRQADQDWFVEQVIPRMVAGTIRRNASVVSEDLFNRMAVQQILKRANNLGDMIAKDFENIETAMAWLKEPLVE